MKKSRLYALLLVACIAGGGWLLYNAYFKSDQCSAGVCLFKNATDIPCPSCGSTRAIISLLHGDPIASLTINPLGVIVFAIVIIVPFWILFDIMRRRNSLLRFFTYIELLLQKRSVAIPLGLLVILNWIWNISKGL